MKKLLIIGGIIVAVFALLIVLNNASNKSKLADNPYGTDDLKQETIDQLDDENYQNIILPDDLQEKVESGEPVTAYFFSPICSHCKAMTPVLMPIVEDMDVDLVQYNIYEFEQGWEDYLIEATPTMIHFEDGKEVARMVGNQPEENIKTFFNDVVLK
ncbi:thioredoxin family protein [Paenisporosarcina quisquiliarum]|jgi:thioredoxin-like negative regulator of GroEL|uniref:Thioredoxin family protein n=1 Tax=Paenisporosarcina quisquiliarum TaxID=365346 RepID=A0A9X3REE4_9BACL|nr:thioredoxin family protein [Paenisporosarcina quisquiliarum]MCZ8538576.1 thioredoxin family protein [Paenisporosarcina quisquiliarum]